MDDQIDEKEVLEYGAWGEEYDIGEDEEERLLIEEEEILEPSVKEGEDYQTYETEEATEAEETPEVELSLEAEEDILDLDANEDVVDFEEPQGNGTEGISRGTPSASTAASPSTSAQSLTAPKPKDGTQERKDSGQKKFAPYPRNPHARRNNMQNWTQNHNPVQMGYVPGRPRPPGFVRQIRPLDPHFLPPVGRRTLMGETHFPPPPLNAPRPLMAGRMEPHFHNFQPRMLHNPLRLPFNEQAPFGFSSPMPSEMNHGGSGLFPNPAYPPRNPREIRNTLPNGPAPPPFAEMRLSFPDGDIMPKLFNRPPPPRPHDIVNENPNMPCLRISTNLPPPPLPIHASAALAQGSNLRMKFQAPQNLMDLVLTAPFGETHLPPPMFQERQQRFRFSAQEHRDHRHDFVPPLGPPPGACKRPPPPAEPSVPVVPVKQIRNEPRAQLPIQRTLTNSHAEVPPLNRNAGLAVNNIIRPSKLLSPNSRRTLLETPPKPGAGLLPTPTSAATTSTSSAPPSASSVAASTPSPIMKIDTQGDTSAPQEMDEYLKKMEEQRKKREEVLRMKEERRRLKLAGQAETSATSNQNTISDPQGRSPNESGGESGNVNGIRRFGNSAAVIPKPKEESSSSFNQNVRHVAIAQRPNQGTPQQNADPQRRYKVIIVKNKMGQILEKRRVPIGEGGNIDVNRAVSQVASAWSNGRMSETVEIENLNSNATEDDVRKLCQMFGAVQEVYPKLQEGKAIVRFANVKGANNFLRNHNTPGILVRYL